MPDLLKLIHGLRAAPNEEERSITRPNAAVARLDQFGCITLIYVNKPHSRFVRPSPVHGHAEAHKMARAAEANGATPRGATTLHIRRTLHRAPSGNRAVHN